MSVRERQSIVRKKSRRQTQEHQAKFGSETEEDDCKRFPCLLQKYCEERLYRFFPIIYNYLLRDDGQLIPIEHALCKGDNTEKLEKLAIYAYSNMEMKLKSITCKTAEGIDTRMFFALNQTLLLFPNLSTLKLDYCNLTSEHIPILQENLNTKKTVSELSLVGNPIKAQNYWRLIHCGLRVLVLKLCQINENGLKKIAKSVLNCSPNVSTLIHLDLSSNMVFDEGCQYIASILRCDRTIQSLNLTDCRIRDNGFKMLVACFTTFSLDKKEIVVRRKIRLEYFKLSQKCSSVADDVSDKNVTEVPDRPKLEDLVAIEETMNKHPFTAESVQQNGEIVCNGNYTLKSLNLSYNHVTKDSLDLLLKTLMEQTAAFGTERGLRRVVLDGNTASGDRECDEVMATVQELLLSKMLRKNSSGRIAPDALSLKRRKSSARSLTSGFTSKERDSNVIG